MRTKFQRLVCKYWPYHNHILCNIMMASAKLEDGNYLVTSFKYTCCLCGETFLDVTIGGMELLQKGWSIEDVFDNWL